MPAGRRGECSAPNGVSKSHTGDAWSGHEIRGCASLFASWLRRKQAWSQAGRTSDFVRGRLFQKIACGCKLRFESARRERRRSSSFSNVIVIVKCSQTLTKTKQARAPRASGSAFTQEPRPKSQQNHPESRNRKYTSANEIPIFRVRASAGRRGTGSGVS